MIVTSPTSNSSEPSLHFLRPFTFVWSCTDGMTRTWHRVPGFGAYPLWSWAVTWSLVGEWTTHTNISASKELGQGKVISTLLFFLLTKGRFLCSWTRACFDPSLRKLDIRSIVYTGAMLSFICSLIWFLGIHCLERRFSEMHFLGVFLLWVFSGRLVFGEREFSADWLSGREKFSGDMRSIGDASWCVEWVKGICFLVSRA